MWCIACSNFVRFIEFSSGNCCASQLNGRYRIRVICYNCLNLFCFISNFNCQSCCSWSFCSEIKTIAILILFCNAHSNSGVAGFYLYFLCASYTSKVLVVHLLIWIKYCGYCVFSVDAGLSGSKRRNCSQQHDKYYC